MKTRMRSFCTVLLAIVIAFGSMMPIYAEEAVSASEIQPRFDHTYSAGFSFVVIDPGAGDFGVSYYANDDTFRLAKLTVVFQKRVLGLFWQTVDIGTENNEWVAYCTDVDGDFYDTVMLDGTGTYRALFKLEVHGEMTTDVIEETIDYQYG